MDTAALLEKLKRYEDTVKKYEEELRQSEEGRRQREEELRQSEEGRRQREEELDKLKKENEKLRHRAQREVEADNDIPVLINRASRKRVMQDAAMLVNRFEHGVSEIPGDIAPILRALLFADPTPGSTDDMEEARDTFPFFSVGDVVVTVEGHLYTVTAKDTYLTREIDNAVARIPRGLEPMARFLYGMLLKSNHKNQTWETRRHTPLDEFEEVIFSVSTYFKPLLIIALLCQEGKTQLAMAMIYNMYAVEGLCPVLVTQLVGGRALRAEEFRRSFASPSSTTVTGPAAGLRTLSRCGSVLTRSSTGVTIWASSFSTPSTCPASS